MAGDEDKKGTSEYSATKAPEVRKEAEEPRELSDERLQPGGSRGADADLGMSGFDAEQAPHSAQSTGQESYGEKALIDDEWRGPLPRK